MLLITMKFFLMVYPIDGTIIPQAALFHKHFFTFFPRKINASSKILQILPTAVQRNGGSLHPPRRLIQYCAFLHGIDSLCSTPRYRASDMLIDRSVPSGALSYGISRKTPGGVQIPPPPASVLFCPTISSECRPASLVSTPFWKAIP